MPTHRTVLAAFLSALFVLALAGLGVTSYLGAHPVAWPVRVATIGAPIGAVLALLARAVAPSKPLRLITFVVLLLVAYGCAHFGKQTFVASYGENGLAGNFWFFGWIATCAMATSVLATATSR